MNKYQQLAYEFQAAPGSLYLPLPTEPTPLPPWAVDLWRRLITEEKDELIQALATGDIAQVVHEQCDLLYVLYGCAVWQGIKAYSPKLLNWVDASRINELRLSISDVLYTFDWHYEFERTRHKSCLNKAINYTASIVYLLDSKRFVKLWPAYQAIHAANMAKLSSGQYIGGKPVKPNGWQPANIREVLAAQGVLLDN